MFITLLFAIASYTNLQQNKLLPKQTVEVTPKSEWRFEVALDQTISVKVIEGIAEIFGTELSNDIEYSFTGTKTAIYSLEGCKVEYSGNVSSEYISEETQMDAYINLFLALNNFRQQSGQAPKVLILGAKDSGKTTLTKILASYSNRLGYEPMVVNLNPHDGVFSVPGTITATPISDILDVEDVLGWGQSYTSGPTLFHPKQPNVRYYGYDKIEENLKFYKYNVSRLGVTVCSRLGEDEALKKSGIIVDSPPLSINDIQLIEDIISDFEINVVIVVGNERLFIDVKKKLAKETLNIIKVPKSGGCVEKDEVFQRKIQQRTVREYFYGNSKTVLSPYTVHVDFTVVNVYKPFIESAELISSVLPIGEDDGEGESDKKLDKLLEKVDPSSSTLQNSVVAILHADKNEGEDDILNSSVLGFAVVTDVDDTKNKLRILIPVPGRLPDKAMILGQLRYVE
jgi:polyribonucleotide 5'-hydroxyl-kinase